VRISTLVNQSVTPPTSGTAEWNIRANFINRSIEEWGNAYNWNALKKTAFVSGASTNGAIPLPTDFKKMVGFPRMFGTSNSDEFGEPWPEIQSQEKYLKTTEDHFYYLLGDRANGTVMVLNPTDQASGASLYIEYYAYPNGVSLSTDTLVIPDPEFLVDRAMAYILQSRNDARFQQFEAQAREKLLLQIDNENEKSMAYRDKISCPEEKYFQFRIGRD
jgi:hypothetical protein